MYAPLQDANQNGKEPLYRKELRDKNCSHSYLLSHDNQGIFPHMVREIGDFNLFGAESLPDKVCNIGGQPLSSNTIIKLL